MLNITTEQQANLLKLARYLERLPTDYNHFNMGSFVRLQSPTPPEQHLISESLEALDDLLASPECNTVACAVGHGPLAGIKPRKGDDSWLAYVTRAFGGGDYDLFEWCFSGAWVDTDNTPQGAAKRIRWLLEKGIPEDAGDQKYRHAPLCYATKEEV